MLSKNIFLLCYKHVTSIESLQFLLKHRMFSYLLTKRWRHFVKYTFAFLQTCYIFVKTSHVFILLTLDKKMNTCCEIDIRFVTYWSKHRMFSYLLTKRWRHVVKNAFLCLLQTCCLNWKLTIFVKTSKR